MRAAFGLFVAVLLHTAAVAAEPARPDFATCSDAEVYRWMSPGDFWEDKDNEPPSYRQAMRAADLWSGDANDALERLVRAVRDPERTKSYPLKLSRSTRLPESGTLRFDNRYRGVWRDSYGEGRWTYTLHWDPTSSWIACAADHHRTDGSGWTHRPVTPWYQLRWNSVPPADARRVAELLVGLAKCRFAAPRGFHDRPLTVGGWAQSGFKVQSRRGPVLARVVADVTTLPRHRVPWKSAAEPTFAAFYGGEVIELLLERVGIPKSFYKSDTLKPQRVSGQPEAAVVENEPAVSELRQATAQVLAVAGEVPGDALDLPLTVAIAAVGEFGWVDLAPAVERASRSLPSMTPWESKFLELTVAADRWEKNLRDRGVPELVSLFGERFADAAVRGRKEFKTPGYVLPEWVDASQGFLLPDLGDAREEIARELRARFDLREKLSSLQSDYDSLGWRPSEYGKPPGWQVYRLRQALALTRRQLERRDRPAGLQAWALERSAGADWAVRRLRNLDPAAEQALAEREMEEIRRAARSLERAERFETFSQRWPVRSQRLLKSLPVEERLWFEFWPSMNPRVLPDDLGVEALVAVLAEVGRHENQRWEALRRLVPTDSPRLHPEALIDETLLRLCRTKDTDDKALRIFFREAIAQALLRRDAARAFEPLLELARGTSDVGEDADRSDADRILRLLAPYARGDTARQEALRPLLEAALPRDRRNAEAVWLADVRALRPQLQTLATGGPAEEENTYVPDSGGKPKPLRLHFARQILTLWEVKDPVARGRLLAACYLQQVSFFNLAEPDPVRDYLEEELRNLAPVLAAGQRAGIVASADAIQAAAGYALELHKATLVDRIEAVLK